MGETIGLIGVGRMGLPLCHRLVHAGFDVTAGDRRGECADEVRAAGGRWIGDTALVVEAADVLITVLPGSDELRNVMSTAIPALRPGTAWLDMTSAAPAVGLDLMTRAQQRGARCLEVTLGGGVTAVRSGTLQLFVGGPADTLDRYRALLEVLGTIEHVGGHGAGYLSKLLVNLLWFGQAVAVGEALLIARREGLELDVFVSALRRSAAASNFVGGDLEALLHGDYLETFGLDRCCEELDAVLDLARDGEVPCELSAMVQRAYRDALSHYGPVDGELRAVALLEERAGLQLRSGL
jgi:3-hydroxyisobutyrate dehydrogenase-like beta-hydroxyacid dehydrogenase